MKKSHQKSCQILQSSVPPLAIDGSKDECFPALKKGKNAKHAEFQKDPFEISPYDMVDAAPAFNVINIDEDEDIDIDLYLIDI